MTITIQNNQEVLFENLLSYRIKVKSSEVNSQFNKFKSFLEQNRVVRKGPLITTVHNVDQIPQEPELDIELLVPVECGTDIPKEYKIKSKFRLVNAISARHQGERRGLEAISKSLLDYISNNQLVQITSVYFVYLSDDFSQVNNDPVVDVYIGVSPCVL